MAEFKLPDVGEGLTEAEIVTWRVRTGDTVAVNDVVVEIETAKSLVELPSPFAGVVQQLMVRRGRDRPGRHGDHRRSTTPAAAAAEPTATTGRPSPIPTSGWREGRGGRGRPRRPRSTSRTRAASGGGEGESLVGTEQGRPRRRTPGAPCRRPGLTGRRGGPAAGAGLLRARDRLACGGRRTREPAVPATAAPASPAGTRALAKPPVRKLAKDLGVDLVDAGRRADPNGAVTRDDVEGAASDSPLYDATRAMSSTGSADGARETREPIKGVRKMMGQAMVGSAFSIPHVTEWVTIDVTRTMEFVDRLEGPSRVPRREGLAAARARARRDARDASDAGDQLLVGRRRAGGRLQELRQPRDRRRHAARARRPERQGRRAALPASTWRLPSTS